MATHAKFSPSKMQQIIACPGSVALSSRVKDTRSTFADEGTGAHYIAALCLTEPIEADYYLGNSLHVDPNGEVSVIPGAGGNIAMDQPFVDSVQMYVDSVRRRSHGKVLLVEQRVEFSQAVGVADQFGTSDAIIIDEQNETLEVGDLKFGMGVKVFAENNEQMLTYAAGALETFAEVLPSIKRIKLFISQPRLDHEDEWECDMDTLTKHISKMRNAVLEATVALTDYENDRELIPEYFRAGEKQCKFCKAKPFCPTLRQFVAKACADDFKAFDETSSVERILTGPPLRVTDPSLLGSLYGIVDMVVDWAKAVRSETDRMVMGGMEVIGPDGLRMKLTEGKRGNRAWVDEKAAEALLIGHLPEDKAYQPRSIITASAAATILDKKKTAATWANFIPLIKQAPGKPTVVLGSDPRPEWSGKAGAEEFEDVAAAN
jgi:Protein of unknown function (DUF2800)